MQMQWLHGKPAVTKEEETMIGYLKQNIHTSYYTFKLYSVIDSLYKLAQNEKLKHLVHCLDLIKRETVLSFNSAFDIPLIDLDKVVTRIRRGYGFTLLETVENSLEGVILTDLSDAIVHGLTCIYQEPDPKEGFKPEDTLVQLK